MGYTKSVECLCVKTVESNLTGSSSLLKATITVSPAMAKFKANGTATLTANETKIKTTSADLEGTASLDSHVTLAEGVLFAVMEGVAVVEPDPTVVYSLQESMSLVGTATVSYTDKFAGDFDDYECSQKLYPIADRAIDSGNYGHFVGGYTNSTSGLYDFIDEGVFTGDYDDIYGNSVLLADDRNTFIRPSAVRTAGQWQYSCELTAPIVRPDHTRLRIRAAAPLVTLEAGKAPQYSIQDIEFKDPSGTIIVKYNDITLRGDSNYADPEDRNFVTYSSSAETNNTIDIFDWEDGFPLLEEGSGYTLTFNVTCETSDDPFTEGFSEGFEEDFTMHLPYASDNDHMAFDGTPITAMGEYFINPTNHLKISALEICNSGRIGPGVANALNIYTQVQATGHRIERLLSPVVIKSSSFSTSLFPDGETVWESEDPEYSNTTPSGAEYMVRSINDADTTKYITMTSSTVADSGKLIVKMSHGAYSPYRAEVTRGAFNEEFDGQSAACIYDGAYNREDKNTETINDGFFDVECVKLRVLAKKEVGSRDYYLDVVGYSDDKLLNITSASGGFLQNIPGGVGTHPVSSGFTGNIELLGGDSLSSDDDYFESSGTPGGDHYLLTQTPLISGVGWEWYEIPLQVYDDQVTLGVSRDYSMSSLFENLYLDIYPIPTGASIAKLELLVRYKPQNALKMITEGGEHIRKIVEDRDAGKIFPISRQSGDAIINAGSGYGPLSTISNIPQAYTTPSSIKSNYSRRWRGMAGLSAGPFDPDAFGFAYYNPHVESPFTSGHYDFERDTGTTVVPNVGTLSGYVTTSLSPYRFQNVGWRFQDNDIFSSEKAGWSSDYKTIDWTALSSGSSNFEDDALYGQIADASRNFLRVRGHNSYIDFGDIDVSGSWSTYVRFSPDVNVSGVGYDLWESGCLFSKWSTGDLEFALHYASGYLRGIARDTTGTFHSVQDPTHYTNYQFPLSVILTYSGGLHLYTDNEFEAGWNVLRDSGAPFTMHVADSDFIVGNCPGSGVGFNAFISEVGISDRGNVVPSGADRTYLEVTAEEFLSNNRMYWWEIGETYTNDAYKIWQNVDEDTRLDWEIGAFNSCQFTLAYDQLQKRTGRDLINFKIKHDGTPYKDNTDLSLPASVDSGVAYHSQMENDFLRFSLSDTSDSFYSTLKRISKDLPRGYKFAEDALIVETVIEHESSGELTWGDGNVGPKLIVSLYTTTKNAYWDDTLNYGLVNRVAHYIPPSACIQRLDSKFTYDSICDETEEWALFPLEARLSEFTEKYYSDDIDDMFLQYDIVYPSGGGFDSSLNIHSAHVRMDHAYVSKSADNDTFNLMTSGGWVVDENLNMAVYNSWETATEQVNLYTAGPFQIEVESGVNMYTSGAIILPTELNLFTENREVLSVSGLNFATSGRDASFVEHTGVLNLHSMGKGVITSSGGPYLGMSMTMLNSDTANIPDGELVNMFTYGSDNTAIHTSMPIFVLNNITSSDGNTAQMNLLSIGTDALFSRFPSGTMNMTIFNNDTPTATNNMNLTLYGDNFSGILDTGNVNLFIGNYGGEGSIYFRWFNNNYGTGIELADNDYAKLDIGDEIRGVDTIGYGSCTGNSPDKATDPEIIVDGDVWREETCNEGGIFRGEAPYTNLSVGYSGHYYGIRKYTDLIPNTPYLATMKIVTGSTDAITVPPDFEEWEYGITSDINYSGVKLIGDEPSGIEPSGRALNDKYGTTVAVKGDLMAIGAPFADVPDLSGHPISNGGYVSLYRRDTDVPGQKAGWLYEDKLMLPSGHRRDFASASIPNLLCYPNVITPEFCVSGYRWNIGQEGRELGHSIDIATEGRETVFIGAPGAAWNREFDTIRSSSGIPIHMVVFTDKFTYNDSAIGSIANTARKYDVLYKYFAAPWNAGASEFQPELQVKLLVCQLVFSDQSRPIVDSEYEWFNHVYINRLDDKDLLEIMSEQDIHNSMMSGIQSAWFDLVKYDTNQPHNGMPPIMGMFKDNSPSTNNTAAFNPVATDFLNFYQEHVYESGVIDPATSAAESGYYNIINAPSEGFVSASVLLMNSTLATGNLISDDALKYITSGVGQEWSNSNAYQFQIPPDSGGRLYIFEKESGNFNLVQEIKSGSVRRISSTFESSESEDYYVGYGTQNNDRFGHSVSVSQGGEVLLIGSPYSSTPCEVFERDDTETTRMYDNLRSWLTYRGKSTEGARYDDLVLNSGADIAKRQVYHELSQGDKFDLRIDELYWASVGQQPISLYKSIYSYGYGNIPYVGTWKFIPDEYAGTSRLGFSTAISEDGNTFAVGAPTDSFNEFDDTNIWFKGYDTWASYTNAGAVRIFESRKNYPHSGVVEYTRFGNMDRTIHSDLVSSGYYDQMGLYFQPDNRPFHRTDFADIEIPREAGLAFIITPELNAASDEIIQNIKDWMALGDRNLVLVGNDPAWEEGGVYKKSNDIINEILQKLGSRMRIHPARTHYESLPNGVSETGVTADHYNVVNSHRPAYGHGTRISKGGVFAKGVGDIRIDLSDLGKELYNNQAPCDDLNFRCEMPLKHNGDLRAEWNAECSKTVGPFTVFVKYKENWPRLFSNTNPSEGCDQPPAPMTNRPNQDIVPVLTAAERVPPSSYVIPATSGYTTVITPQYETVCRTVSETYYEFGDYQEDAVKFEFITDGSGSTSGTFNSFDLGTFFDPDVTNDRDGIIQATGDSYFLPPELSDRKVADVCHMMTSEVYYDGVSATTSEVILIASVSPESENNLGYGNVATTNNDQNIYFYNNLIMNACNSAGHVIQLGGWTGRTSFTDAYSNSRLTQAWDSYTQTYEENKVYVAGDSIIPGANVVWIPMPTGTPAPHDINIIKAWLATGDKKLVITYNSSQIIADNVATICDSLGLNSKPWFSDSQAEYLSIGLDVEDNGQQKGVHQSITGCFNGYGWDSSSSSCGAYCTTEVSSDVATSTPYIPIMTGANTTSIISYNDELREDYYEVPEEKWRINAAGTASISGLQPGSGYRIFINYVSETVDEKFGINMRFSNFGRKADSTAGTVATRINKSATYTPETIAIDCRAADDNSSITFDTSHLYSIDESEMNGGIPKTTRIVSISGCLLPIETRIETEDICESVYVGDLITEEYWEIEERTVTIAGYNRPIMTLNDKYCDDDDGCVGKGNQWIQDGPVVVAEEYEHFSPFNNGNVRSKIILITDSTIIQGQNPYYRNDAIYENQRFIRSLYPASPRDISANGERYFQEVQKLLSPERGSPAKYNAATSLTGNVSRFTNGTAKSLSAFTDTENDIAPADVSRELDPISPEEIKEYVKDFGDTTIPIWGPFPRFSGTIDGTLYVDAGIGNGLSPYMKVTGRDYLDPQLMLSGYPGDLFGYSISMVSGKLIVGSPFNAFDGETVAPWAKVVSSGTNALKISGNGGPGAAFYFERTGSGVNAESSLQPWEFKQKIQPSSINIGIDGATISDLVNEKGDHNNSADFVLRWAHLTDQFGQSVSMDADMVAIGAPNHDFETIHQHLFSGSTAFLRKEFNAEYEIHKHEYWDLGDSGNRIDLFSNNSGTMVLNNGAVYTYRHKITDWPTRTKEWVYAEKINAQGYADRNTGPASTSGTENDFFGRDVYLDRARRGDGDYTLAIGSPHHKYATSGSHPTSQPMQNAGAAYVYDAMLREQVPSIPNSGNWIEVEVYGDRAENGLNKLTMKVYQNTTSGPVTYETSGIVFSNVNGDIFLEGSGFDSSNRGFIAHRPYVEEVIGTSLDGTKDSGILNLVTSGKPAENSGEMNLVMLGADSAIVYNNMNLYTTAWNQLEVGSGNTPLSMYVSGKLPALDSGIMNMFNSGTIQNTGQLNIRIRGK